MEDNFTTEFFFIIERLRTFRSDVSIRYPIECQIIENYPDIIGQF